MLDYLFPYVFVLIGKAYDDHKSNDANEEKKLKHNRNNQKKAMQMFKINLCLYPNNISSWFNLGKSYYQLSFFYFD